MAKDRFNRFKPVNWNSEFKQTGNTGYRYNTQEKYYLYNAHKSNAALKEQLQQRKLEKQRQKSDNFRLSKKVPRTEEQNNLLATLVDYYNNKFNDWEKEFFKSILQFPYILSDKQQNIMFKTQKKYNFAFSDNEWNIWKQIVREASESPFY